MIRRKEQLVNARKFSIQEFVNNSDSACTNCYSNNTILTACTAVTEGYRNGFCVSSESLIASPSTDNNTDDSSESKDGGNNSGDSSMTAGNLNILTLVFALFLSILQ